MINPYSLSTFGRAYKRFEAMRSLMAQETSHPEEVRAAWEKLNPELSKLFCELPPTPGVESFVNEHFTGMATAASLGLPDCMHATWERMRVLQGLTMHLQMWVFFGTHIVATHHSDFTIDNYNYHCRNLINQIADLLEDCDSIPNDLDDQAVDVINECQLEASAEDENALFAARYRFLRERDLETISQGGVFAGMTPDNVVLNGEDLDQAVDAGRAGRQREHAAEFRAAQATQLPVEVPESDTLWLLLTGGYSLNHVRSDLASGSPQFENEAKVLRQRAQRVWAQIRMETEAPAAQAKQGGAA